MDEAPVGPYSCRGAGDAKYSVCCIFGVFLCTGGNFWGFVANARNCPPEDYGRKVGTQRN